MENNSKTILTFLLGAAAGVAIGYFLASDNKEEFIDELNSTAKKVKENIEGGIEKGKQFVDEMKNKVTDLLDKAQHMEKDLKTWWAELKNDFSVYLDARTQLTKIQVYEKIAKVVGVVISFFVLALLIGFVIVFFIIMVGSWITALTNSVAIGMSSVAMIIIISFLLLAMKRKTWLEKPIADRVIQALYDEDHLHEKTEESNGTK